MFFSFFLSLSLFRCLHSLNVLYCHFVGRLSLWRCPHTSSSPLISTRWLNSSSPSLPERWLNWFWCHKQQTNASCRNALLRTTWTQTPLPALLLYSHIIFKMANVRIWCSESGEQKRVRRWCSAWTNFNSHYCNLLSFFFVDLICFVLFFPLPFFFSLVRVQYLTSR